MRNEITETRMQLSTSMEVRTFGNMRRFDRYTGGAIRQFKQKTILTAVEI